MMPSQHPQFYKERITTELKTWVERENHIISVQAKRYLDGAICGAFFEES
jgi:hypothetical protein